MGLLIEGKDDGYKPLHMISGKGLGCETHKISPRIPRRKINKCSIRRGLQVLKVLIGAHWQWRDIPILVLEICLF